jgi:hypothetical protein
MSEHFSDEDGCRSLEDLVSFVGHTTARDEL